MKTLELFSGAGGLAKGLELSGFNHASFVEYNKHACNSLYQNFDHRKVYFGDVKDFDFDKLNKIDLVAGGPPCQPFSLGGKHKANNDTRDMFPYAIQAIDHLSPKAFVFENVKGLLRSSFSSYFDYIILRLSYPDILCEASCSWIEHLEELRRIEKLSYIGKKYKVSYKLINSADYGVPQTRERVVIVGIRSDIPVNWKFPEPTHSEDRLIWDMHVTGEYWDRHKVKETSRPQLDVKLRDKVSRLANRYGMFEPDKKPWNTIRDVLFETPDPRSNHNIIDHIFRDGARTYQGHTGSDYDWPAKTIKAGGHGVPGGENMIRYPDGQVRYLTIYEAKKLQTFPDDYIITGAWGEGMRQIGNAVPVLLAQKIGEQLFILLNKVNSEINNLAPINLRASSTS